MCTSKRLLIVIPVESAALHMDIYLLSTLERIAAGNVILCC